MASAMASNGAPVRGVSADCRLVRLPPNPNSQVRSNRIGSSSGINNDRARSSQSATMGPAFGSGKSWNSNIWGSNNITPTFNGDGGSDPSVSRGTIACLPILPAEQSLTTDTENVFEGMTGSGSLLSTSESDGWAGRPNLPWSTVTPTTSLGMTTSPVEGRGGDRSVPAKPDTGESYFALPRTSAIGHTSTGSAPKTYLNSTSDTFPSSAAETISFGSFGNYRNDDAGHRPLSSTFGGNAVTAGFQSKSGLVASARDAQTDILGSMGVGSFPQASSESISAGQSRQGMTAPYSHLVPHSVSTASQRPVHSTHQSFNSESQGIDSRYFASQMDINSGLNRLQLNDHQVYANQQTSQRPTYIPHSSYDASLNRYKYQSGADDGTYRGATSSYAETPAEIPYGYPSISRMRERASPPPAEYGRGSFYSVGGTPPVPGNQRRPSSGNRLSGQISDGQAMLLERKLRGLQQEQDFSQVASNAMQQRLPYATGYDLAGYSTPRLNAFNPYYQMAQFGGMPAAAMTPRGSHREHDPSQVVRSPLLEEFRTNNKGNKRYELKVRLSSRESPPCPFR